MKDRNPETRGTTDRNASLAKIHIGKKVLGLDDETYRDMLKSITGKTSAKELTYTERYRVLAHMHKAGFHPKGKGKGSYPGRPAAIDGVEKGPQLKKIEAYLTEAKRPWAYVHAMAQHMFKIERVEWCDTKQLRKIIMALQIDAERHDRYTG